MQKYQLELKDTSSQSTAIYFVFDET